MKLYRVDYQYAYYSGHELVEAEDEEQAIAMTWRRLRSYMTMPMTYQSAKAQVVGERP